jgi:hypothetical protein
MNAEEKSVQKKRLSESYTELDKETVKSQFKGIGKLYNSFLLSNFSLMFWFYKFKN